MAPVAFDELPLHDAILYNVSVDWKARTCRASLAVFLRPKANAVPCVLEWEGVREVRIPIRQDWGPSASINDHHMKEPGYYAIGMQSGDTLVIEADAVTFQERSAVDAA